MAKAKAKAKAKATHTPGPWTVKRCLWQKFPLVVCGKEFYPAAIFSDGRLNRGTARANARLIAAAPELLESLRSLVNTLEAAWSEGQITAPRFVQCQLGEEVKRANAAIAKAEVASRNAKAEGSRATGCGGGGNARIEVAADESCYPERENDTRSPERGNDA